MSEPKCDPKTAITAIFATAGLAGYLAYILPAIWWALLRESPPPIGCPAEFVKDLTKSVNTVLAINTAAFLGLPPKYFSSNKLFNQYQAIASYLYLFLLCSAVISWGRLNFGEAAGVGDLKKYVVSCLVSDLAKSSINLVTASITVILAKTAKTLFFIK